MIFSMKGKKLNILIDDEKIFYIIFDILSKNNFIVHQNISNKMYAWEINVSKFSFQRCFNSKNYLVNFGNNLNKNERHSYSPLISRVFYEYMIEKPIEKTKEKEEMYENFKNYVFENLKHFPKLKIIENQITNKTYVENNFAYDYFKYLVDEITLFLTNRKYQKFYNEIDKKYLQSKFKSDLINLDVKKNSLVKNKKIKTNLVLLNIPNHHGEYLFIDKNLDFYYHKVYYIGNMLRKKNGYPFLMKGFSCDVSCKISDFLNISFFKKEKIKSNIIEYLDIERIYDIDNKIVYEKK